MPGILDRGHGLQQVVRHVTEVDVTKPVQGVFLGMAVMGGIWAISALSLSRLWDAVATGGFMLLCVSGLMYWNNRKTKEIWMSHRHIASLLPLVACFAGCMASPGQAGTLIHQSKASSIREVLQKECALLVAECAAHPTSALQIELVSRDLTADLACADVLDHAGSCSALTYPGRLPDDMVEEGVDAGDIRSALLFTCSTLVHHCSEEGIDDVRVYLLGNREIHEDFRCEEILPDRDNGCKNVLVRVVAPPVALPKHPPRAPPPTTLAPISGGAWQLHPEDPLFPPGATSFPHWWSQEQLDQWKDEEAVAWSDLGPDCARACAAIRIDCAGVAATCSRATRSLGFTVNGRETVITCAQMKQWTCTEGVTFTGALCKASLCAAS